jgi:hypothetical protein
MSRRGAPQAFDRERYIIPSPPLDDDMYGDLVPPTIAELVSYLEVDGVATPDLFGADPRVRDINGVLDELRAASINVDVHAVCRGESHLAAAALAAYCRSLPEPLLPSPFAEQLCQAVEHPDFALRVAGIRDIMSTLPEANQAVLHRLFHFLSRLGGAQQSEAQGNGYGHLALFWASMLLPSNMSRVRDRRIKEFRLLGLLLQQSPCIFEGSLEAVELPEPELPPHLAAEMLETQAASRQWVKIKASLLRDTKGAFRFSLLEDDGGVYINKIEPTDVCDDREKLQYKDYLVSISRKSVDEMTLAEVKEIVKHAKNFLELEVRRYAGAAAIDERRRQEEQRQQREAEQLRRYREQVQDYVDKKPL